MVAQLLTPPTFPDGRILVTAKGAVGDGTAGSSRVTANTSAFQAAIDEAAATANMEGVVYVPPGVYYLRQLRMKRRVSLIGSGWGSYLVLAAGTNDHLIILDSVNVDMVRIANVRINGNKPNNNAGSAIRFDNTGGSFTHSSPYHVLSNVFVESCKGPTFALINNLGMYVEHCHAKLGDAEGFLVDSTDNFLHACTAATMGKSGFKLMNGNNRISICKAYTCGQAMAAITDEGDGFLNSYAGRNQYIGCEAQDNNRHGFVVIGALSRGTQFIDAVADSNAVQSFGGLNTAAGFVLDAAEDVRIAGTADNVRGTQDVGITFTNGAVNNDVDLIARLQNDANYTGTLTGNTVRINRTVVS